MNLNNPQVKPRTCTQCDKTKSTSAFYADPRTGKRYPYCKECSADVPHSQAKPRVCTKCGVMKNATRFHTDQRTRERYPHCIDCGAQTAAMRTCTECKQTLQLNKAFGRTRTGTIYTYHAECKHCRPAVISATKTRAAESRRNEDRLAASVKKEAKTDASRAKALARLATKDRLGWLKPVEKQSTNTTNPFEWRTYVQPFHAPQSNL